MVKKNIVKNKKNSFNVSETVSWLVGIIVSLAVGSGMIQKVLTIPYIPTIVTVVTGWIVVIGAIISIIASLFGR